MSAVSAPSRWSWLRASHEVNLLLAVFYVLVLTTILDSQHNYWNKPYASAVDMVRYTSMLGLYALGAAIVIIAGGIDLSTGSVMAFGGTICGSILLLLVPEEMIGAQPLPMWAILTAIAGTLVSGFLVGSLHAWLITVVGLPPFIATLGTLVGLRSLSRAICDSVTLAVQGGSSTQINLFDARMRYIAQSVWIPAVLLAVLAVVLAFFLSRTVSGRHLYALGGNEQAARLSGIRTDRLKWLAYVISALLSSLAGIIAICEQGVAAPQTLGRGYELNAIAAAVVGGCSLQGGVGTITGTVIGALFLRAVIDGVAKIIKTGADVYEGLVVGMVVVCAVTFTQSAQAGGNARRYFAGALGLVTILNLTLLAAAFMALIVAGYLGSRFQLDTGWLSLWAGLTTLGYLLIIRLPTFPRKTVVAVGWLVAMGIVLIGADQAYPGWQRGRVVSIVQQLGGNIAQSESGIQINLAGTACTDQDVARLARGLRFFSTVERLDLSKTPITDKSLAAVKPLTVLKQLNLTDTETTPSGRARLRSVPGLKVLP